MRVGRGGLVAKAGGTWDRLLAHAQTKSDAVGYVHWEVSVDDTAVGPT